MIVAARATARVQCAAPRARRHRSRRHRVARASSGVNDDDASDAAMYEELEKINAANNSKSASDWIGAWSKAITDPPSEAEVEKMRAAAMAAEEERLAEARSYRYVFAHDLLSGSGDSFAGKYLKDALGMIDIELETPDLVCGNAEYTVSSALEKLTAALNGGEGRKERPVRLIGSSTGALVAALYAERNRDRVDKVFLLAPTWGLANILTNFEKSYGVNFSKAFVDDASTLPEYPTVTCPAYIVHGHDDDVSPLDNSARWMQMASQWMRQEGDSDENVAERRLLEVSGLGHGVETALPMSMGRFTEFFKIPRVDLYLREREP